MTNLEINLKKAVENKESGKLNAWETDFVEQFEDCSKKELKRLSKKQFDTLKKIADK